MNAALAEVESWMRQVVVGLGLCPFAAHPLQHGRVRLSLGTATDEAGLLALLADECRRLDATPATQLETTVIVVPCLATRACPNGPRGSEDSGTGPFTR